MGQKFKDISIKYLTILLILISLIIIFFLASLGLFIKHKFYRPNSFHKKLGYIFLASSILLIIITYITFFVLVYDLEEDLQITSDKDLVYDFESNNLRYDINQEEKIIFKKLKPMIIYKNNDYIYDNQHVKSFNLKKIKNKTTLFNIGLFSLVNYYQWRTIIYRQNYCEKIKYFVKTYNLQEKDCSWTEEYVPNDFISYKNLDKEKIISQFEELDEFLKKERLIITDIHEENIRLDKDGNLKIIDGELFSYKEYFLIKNLIYTNGKVKNCKNIISNGYINKFLE